MGHHASRNTHDSSLIVHCNAVIRGEYSIPRQGRPGSALRVDRGASRSALRSAPLPVVTQVDGPFSAVALRRGRSCASWHHIGARPKRAGGCGLNRKPCPQHVARPAPVTGNRPRNCRVKLSETASSTESISAAEATSTAVAASPTKATSTAVAASASIAASTVVVIPTTAAVPTPEGEYAETHCPPPWFDTVQPSPAGPLPRYAVACRNQTQRG